MEIVERGAALAGRAQLVPGFVREALDVVRQVAGELDDRRAQPGSGAMPERLNRASMDAANSSAGILSSRMTGPAL